MSGSIVVTTYWWSAIAAGLAVWLVLRGALLYRLRTRHPGVYERIGSPPVVIGLTLDQRFRLLKWFTEAGPPETEDLVLQGLRFGAAMAALMLGIVLAALVVSLL